MRYVELLQDPQCLERGEHLVQLYIGGLTQLRYGAPPEDDILRDYDSDIFALIDEAVDTQNTDEVSLAHFGRTIIETRRKQEAVKVWRQRQRDEVGTPEWYKAFAPAINFLTDHAGKAIAAETTRKDTSDISSFKLVSKQYPQTIGGFVIPKVIGNARLNISGRSGSEKPIARLQVIDRLEADTYGTHLKIAIAE